MIKKLIIFAIITILLCGCDEKTSSKSINKEPSKVVVTNIIHYDHQDQNMTTYVVLIPNVDGSGVTRASFEDEIGKYRVGDLVQK